MAQVQSLVGELRSLKLRPMAKKKSKSKKQKKVHETVLPKDSSGVKRAKLATMVGSPSH